VGGEIDMVSDGCVHAAGGNFNNAATSEGLFVSTSIGTLNSSHECMGLSMDPTVWEVPRTTDPTTVDVTKIETGTTVRLRNVNKAGTHDTAVLIAAAQAANNSAPTNGDSSLVLGDSCKVNTVVFNGNRVPELHTASEVIDTALIPGIYKVANLTNAKILVGTLWGITGLGTLLPGGVTILPTGIASTEAFGIPTVVFATIYPSGITSGEHFGVVRVIQNRRTVFGGTMDTDLEMSLCNPAEFGEPISFEASPPFSVNGLFDNEYIGVNPGGDGELMSSTPAVWVPSKMFKKRPDKGMRVIVRGVRYRAMTYEPDGAGLAVIRLNHE